MNEVVCVQQYKKVAQGNVKHSEHPSCIPIHPDSSFQKAFPWQLWHDSDTLGRRNLTSGQRSIKGNLFLLRKAMILLSSSNHPPSMTFLKRRVNVHSEVKDSFCCFFVLYTNLLKFVPHLSFVFVIFLSKIA